KGTVLCPFLIISLLFFMEIRYFSLSASRIPSALPVQEKDRELSPVLGIRCTEKEGDILVDLRHMKIFKQKILLPSFRG
ncbi:MAG: hypothetical protein SOT54_06675, partial [Candidatus Limivivens sp.]|nr:hypothetical protein [Candidatus Limivivens sp.]